MRINTHALEKLSNYSWPGNVRELQHSVEKAVIMCESNVLLPSDFELQHIVRKTRSEDELTLEQMERRMILESLRRHGNNLSVVASKLGITRQTLYNKLRKMENNKH